MLYQKYKNQSYQIHIGNALDVIGNIGIVHCVVTSPPYFKKRTYGESAQEIGIESQLDQYVSSLVNVFNSIRLHERGSIWVNLGDKRSPDGGLLLVPERFALAMMANGWKVVDNVIWAKIVDHDDGSVDGHCMIEPAIKRLNGNGWEYFYRFVKSSNPYNDHCAVRMNRDGEESFRYMPKELMTVDTAIEGRTAHNVWRVKMGQTKKKHYAVFPLQLCERPIAMNCPMKINAETYDPIERIVEMTPYDEKRGAKRIFGKYSSLDEEYDPIKSQSVSGRIDSGRQYVPRKPVTKGWTEATTYASGIVLDPFCGSGTTGEVALKLGRSFIGIDLYEKYAEISAERCKETFEYLDSNSLDPWLLQQ